MSPDFFAVALPHCLNRSREDGWPVSQGTAPRLWRYFLTAYGPARPPPPREGAGEDWAGGASRDAEPVAAPGEPADHAPGEMPEPELREPPPPPLEEESQPLETRGDVA